MVLGISSRRVSYLWLAAGLLALPGIQCSRSTDSSSPIRLVDRFQAEGVEGAPLQVKETPGLESWMFRRQDEGTDSSPAEAAQNWLAADAITGLKIQENGLAGNSTTDWPLLLAKRSQGLDENDLIHSLEIRLRVSAGSNLSVALLGKDIAPLPKLPEMLRGFPWWERIPVIAGESFQTYQLRFAIERASSEVHHVVLRPTDAAGDFEIEYVRLVSRRQHLARIPSGVGWHGFQDIYRETLVSRSPETLRFELVLPPRPWLDLHVGTVDYPPVNFRVELRPGGGEPRVVLNRTVTTPHRWEETSIDLSQWAGRQVEMGLILEAEEAGSLGFWGTPVIRSSMPPPRLAPKPRLETAAAGPPQGVVLILADTLRKDHLDGYGYRRKTAPLIAEMAARGVRFDHSLVQATWTKVSAPSILTSLYPTAHRVHSFADRISAAADTLAEAYRDAGYSTVAYSSVPFTGKFTNLHQGFEELHESSSLSRQHSSKTAREYVDRLANWLSRHRETPFFVFLHVFDPHDPFEPDRPWNTLWADPSRRDEHTRTEEQMREVISDPLLRLFGMPTREELIRGGVDPEAFVAYNVDWYDGSIRGLDTEVARLMGHLQDLGLDEKTLVVFTSDHGEEFLEHGRSFHGQSTYGELTQVPLILYQPALIPEGLAVDELTQSIDIMPTLLELSQLPVPQQAMGQSLLPLIEAARRVAPREKPAEFLELATRLGWQRRPAVTEKAKTEGGGSPPPRDTESFAIVWDGWKLVHHTVRPEGAPEYELFKFPEDAFDLSDVAAANPEIVQKLADRLGQWREKTLAARLPDALPTQGLSKEELDRFRSLGYIQ